MIKQGSVEEVELDLSAIKANKRKRRNSRASPMSKGSSSRKSERRMSGRSKGGNSSKASSGVKETNSFTEQLRMYRESSKERGDESEDNAEKDRRVSVPVIQEVAEL